jgi:hypothetical protein
LTLAKIDNSVRRIRRWVVGKVLLRAAGARDRCVMVLSPGSGGPLVDPDGNAWSMSRRRLDLRVVRRGLRSDRAVVLVGESSGFDLRWVTPEQRPGLWEQLRKSYQGPGGSGGDYMGYEFVNNHGARLLYLEKDCCR